METNYKERLYIDLPAPDRFIITIAEKIKSVMPDRNQTPLAYRFEGEQSKDFYLGMIAADKAIASAIRSGLHGQELSDFQMALSSQANLHAHDKIVALKEKTDDFHVAAVNFEETDIYLGTPMDDPEKIKQRIATLETANDLLRKGIIISAAVGKMEAQVTNALKTLEASLEEIFQLKTRLNNGTRTPQ